MAVAQTAAHALVVRAYGALMHRLQYDRAQDWAHIRLMTINEVRRQLLREMGKTLEWAVERTHEGMNLQRDQATSAAAVILVRFLKSISCLAR
jgi:hypothetical protein